MTDSTRKKDVRHEVLADGVELWLGDCLSILPKLKVKASAVLTDPPYEDHMHRAKAQASKRRLRNDGGTRLRSIGFSSIADLRPLVTPLMVEACEGWLLAFCTPEGVHPWRDAVEAAGARYKRACFWFKPDAAPQMNGQGPAMAVECFVAAWCGAGHSRWNGGGRRNLFTHPVKTSTRDGTHETEKPLALMLELIQLFTNHGDVVLDPFMGSGTTGVAAVRSGRRFIGIEKSKEHYETARRRIVAALRQPDLFVSVPKLKQSSMLSHWNRGEK